MKNKTKNAKTTQSGRCCNGSGRAQNGQSGQNAQDCHGKRSGGSGAQDCHGKRSGGSGAQAQHVER